jgi:hypothetical protein
MAPHDLDQGIDIDVQQQRRRGMERCSLCVLAGGVHGTEAASFTRKTRSSRNGTGARHWVAMPAKKDGGPLGGVTVHSLRSLAERAFA